MSEHDNQVAFFTWVRANRLYNKRLEIKAAMELCYGNSNGGKRPHKLTKYGKTMMRKYGSIPPKHIGKKGWFYSPVAQSMVAEGLTEGIPDINLDQPVDNLHGLRIEMKYRIKSLSDNLMIKHRAGEYLVDLSDEQKEKRLLLIKSGFRYVICYTTAEAKQAVIDYLPYDKNNYIEV